MNIFKKMLLTITGGYEEDPKHIHPFVDKDLKKFLQDKVVRIAPTEEFNEHQGTIGNFLPSEVEEDVQKILPKRATEGSAGIDLRAYIEDSCGTDILPGQTVLIKTGFKWAIPTNHVGMVCSRSGLALKNSVFVLNAPGIVDSDYRGDVGVILCNAGQTPFHIDNGDRIAQMVIIETANLPLEKHIDIDITETTRGTGGFGSTGKGN